MAYLDPYTGPFDEEQARHLLRRTMFGPTQSMVTEAKTLGLAGTIDKLFSPHPQTTFPLKSIPDGTGDEQINDPTAKYGETWVNGAPFPNVNPPMLRNRILRSRIKSLYSWTFLLLLDDTISITDKMTIFWHNHFVIGNSTIAHREYNYYTLLRSQALGNFKQITKDITIDSGMLLYLSGAENTDAAPNENYSRELLELFTIGKGPQVGQGDYTNYTEDDVEVMARVLTGWSVSPVSSVDTLTARFRPNRHTDGTKTLSKRFDNAQIAENGDNEYKDLIDIIFTKKECARFIVRKMYRWFVASKIDEGVENFIIEPLATQLYNDNYNVTPTLKKLFQSDHFFESVACMIKNPIDLILSASRGLGIENPRNNVEKEYDHAYNYYLMAADLEQAVFQHPNVAGWKAYYQAPQFDKSWINNLLLPKRHEFCRLMVVGGNFSYNNVRYTISETIPVLDIAEDIADAVNPNSLIEEIAKRIFAYPISSSQVDSLKEVLIPGLPDFEWTVEYGKYLNDKNDTALKESVENKLKALFSTMIRMSEFQVM